MSFVNNYLNLFIEHFSHLVLAHSWVLNMMLTKYKIFVIIIFTAIIHGLIYSMVVFIYKLLNNKYFKNLFLTLFPVIIILLVFCFLLMNFLSTLDWFMSSSLFSFNLCVSELPLFVDSESEDLSKLSQKEGPIDNMHEFCTIPCSTCCTSAFPYLSSITPPLVVWCCTFVLVSVSDESLSIIDSDDYKDYIIPGLVAIYVLLVSRVF